MTSARQFGNPQGPPVWYRFSQQNLPGLFASSSGVGHDSSIPPRYQSLHPMMLTRSPSLLLSTSTSSFLALPCEYEPFPHAMTEWRDSPLYYSNGPRSFTNSCVCLNNNKNNNHTSNCGLQNGKHARVARHLEPTLHNHQQVHRARHHAARKKRNLTLTDETSLELRRMYAQKAMSLNSRNVSQIISRSQRGLDNLKLDTAASSSRTYGSKAKDDNGSSSSCDSGIHASSATSVAVSGAAGNDRKPVAQTKSSQHPVASRTSSNECHASGSRSSSRALPSPPGQSDTGTSGDAPMSRTSSKRVLPVPPPPTHSADFAQPIGKPTADISEAPAQPVVNRGRLAALLRSVKMNRSVSKDKDHQRVLKESPSPRVFGRDLEELARGSANGVPDVLVICTRFIETHAITDGVYRISGVSSNIKRIKDLFESGSRDDLSSHDWIMQDIHCVPALVKQFFRELPTPLLPSTVQPGLSEAARAKGNNSDSREAMDKFRKALYKLPQGHYNTLHHLMHHLKRISEMSNETGMTSKNLAIVWAPNVLRPHLGSISSSLSSSPSPSSSPNLEAIQGAKEQMNLGQNTTIVQFLIENANWIFEGGDEAKKNQVKDTVTTVTDSGLEEDEVPLLETKAKSKISSTASSSSSSSEVPKPRGTSLSTRFFKEKLMMRSNQLTKGDLSRSTLNLSDINSNNNNNHYDRVKDGQFQRRHNKRLRNHTVNDHTQLQEALRLNRVSVRTNSQCNVSNKNVRPLTVTMSSNPTSSSRPHSIDAEFMQKLKEMGLAKALPSYMTTT